VVVLVLAVGVPTGGAGGTPAGAAPAPPYAPSLTGRAVNFALSGFEPDFDPLYRVIISATLHDGRRPGIALPDAMLVLSAYLEVFQPGTTPVLPDLLHPDRIATSLAGFLQGAAALVNAAGRTVYRGSLLAEIFGDNTVHIVLRLYPVKAPLSALPLQLKGTFTLYKNKTQRGALQAAGPPVALSALAVRPGRLPSWQTVVGGLSVTRPRMMGAPATRPPVRATPPPPPRVVSASRVIAGALGVTLGLVGIALACASLLRRHGRPATPAQSVLPKEAGERQDAGETADAGELSL
jgi:hypothetical protein